MTTKGLGRSRVVVGLVAVGLATLACGGEPRRAQPASGPLVPVEPQRPKIVVIGDGVTAGVGLLEAQAYPSQLQARLDELGYDVEIVNAGAPGDTTATARARLEAVLDDSVRILIVAVGAEDVRRGVPAVTIAQNLAALIEQADTRRIAIILAGASAPPEFGEQYVTSIAGMFQDLARRYNLVFVPALLEGVAGRPELTQSDGVSPNAEGARLVADRIWRALQPMVDAIAVRAPGSW